MNDSNSNINNTHDIESPDKLLIKYENAIYCLHAAKHRIDMAIDDIARDDPKLRYALMYIFREVLIEIEDVIRKSNS